MSFSFSQRTSIKTALHATVAINNIVVCGWVRTRRDAKGFSFLELNDGSCLANIQIIIDETSSAYAHIDSMTTGSAIAVQGNMVESPGKGQTWEIQSTDIQILGLADAETFPLQKKRHSDEFLRTIAHLRPRTNKFGAMFRLRSETAFAVHEYFRENGFFNVHSPILTGSDCEGAGEMFRVTTLEPTGAARDGTKFDPKAPYSEDFFGKECNLTVSGQLEAESMALSLGKVYTFGPTFRAENSNTPRHCAEFWMIEPEIAFADLTDNMNLAEDLTRTVVKRIIERCEADIDLFNRFVDTNLATRLTNLVENDFARVSYTNAVEILNGSKKKFEFPVFFGADLQTEHERFLAEEFYKKPVIVFNYPKEIKAFYMRLNDDNKTVAAMDVLVPGIGELIGGSQREDRFDVLERRIKEMGQNPEDYWWYLDFRKFGSAPHAGFGLGFERLLMLLTGTTNIRDVIAFPRTPGSLEF